jgi:hypothetical protein
LTFRFIELGCAFIALQGVIGPNEAGLEKPCISLHASIDLCVGVYMVEFCDEVINKAMLWMSVYNDMFNN